MDKNKEEKYIDLHVHTTYSDGNFSPKQVVEYCKQINIVAVGITDHDTTDGIEEAVEVGKKEGVEIIPGVELSAEFKDSTEGEVHILGYFIDWNDKTFQQQLKIFRQARQERAYKILNKLNVLGINIPEQEVFGRTGQTQSIGRLHFARLMLEKKIVNSVKEAFELYLGYGKPAYVPKLKLQPQEAISMILRVKGIPVLAHPYFGVYIDPKSIKKLVNQGIKGIEVYHSKHHSNVIEELINIADKYGLLITGGSDCHGPMDTHPPILGSMKIPYSIIEPLKKYKQDVETYREKILT
ncbi:MAG: PHP domain-containing protein [Endomicrobia bacterium]|nr:PHP domain-containing protein [Endomicrobiia bacterium]